MAPWHVVLDILPARAVRARATPFTPAVLESTAWWSGTPLPVDLADQLEAVAGPGRVSPDGSRTWGPDEGNRVDVLRDGGAVRALVARVDVRKLDAKFGAALLALVRRLDAVLVRRDGVVVDPTIGAFGAALRGSQAWAHANDTATWLAAQQAGADDD